MADDSVEYYMQYVGALDEGNFEVSDWEASFITSLLERQPSFLSHKQKSIIARMAAHYLGEVIQ